MNILVVDDATFMRMMLKGILEKNGHTVVGEAENGNQAIDKYKELKPDLVTMDITMPEADGIEGLRAIMAHDPNAKVIMCSAMGQETYILQAIQNGAKDFIVKPFEENRVLEALAKQGG